jgi:hypothetical protein
VSENKEGLPNGVPHLIYISREKQHKHPHNYKDGAMNVLVRSFCAKFGLPPIEIITGDFCEKINDGDAMIER